MRKKLKTLAILLFGLSLAGGCTYSKTGPDTETEGKQVSPDATTGQTTGPKLPDAPTGPTGETGSTGPTGATRWTKFLASDQNDAAMAMAVSSTGEVVVVGNTEGYLDDVDGKQNAGGTDFFVAKFAPDGTLLWIDQRGSSAGDVATGVAIDASNNIYVTGWTWGPFDGKQNEAKIDIFLVKYDGSGTHLWTTIKGTEEDDHANDVAVDEQGNPWVVGESNMAGGAGGYDAKVWKFNPDTGELDPVGTTMGSAGDDSANSLVVVLGNVGVAGTTAGTIGTVSGFDASIGETDLFLAFGETQPALSPSVIQPPEPSNSVKDDTASRLVAIGSDMDHLKIYVGGWTMRNPIASFAPDGFLAQIPLVEVFNNPGSPLPKAAVSTSGADYIYGIAADPTDPTGQKAYAVGQVSGFMPGVSSDGLGQGDLLIAKYDFSKFDPTKFNPVDLATYVAPVWFHQDGTPEKDEARDIAVDANGNVYVVGVTMGSLDGHTSAGFADAFLRKYNSDGVLQ